MSGIHGDWRLRTSGPEMDPGFDVPGATPEPNSTPAEAPVTRGSSGPVAMGGGEWAVRFADGAAPAAAAQPSRAASMPLVKQGSKGEEVKQLQTELNEFRAKIGLKQLPVTGTFGPQTKEAVVQFQKMWGLDADGVVGAGTWRRLMGEANPAPATPPAGSIQAKVMAHKEAILAASEKYGIPPAIIAGMIQKESGGRADIVGITNDKGLMQINPDAHPNFFKTKDWKNPNDSVMYGASLVRDNLKAFSGDIDKALAAYNAGIGGVRSGLRNGKTLDDITYKPHYVSNIETYAKKYEDYF